MKKEGKYVLFLVLAALIYAGVKLFSPRSLDWTVTYNKDDKNPFGGYVLNELIQDVFPQKKILHSYKTLYELCDSIKTPVNFISISNSFYAAEEDWNALLDNVSKGGNAFIAAQYFSEKLTDTLGGISTNDYYYHTNHSRYLNKDDTANLYFKNPMLKSGGDYRFPRNNIHNYFDTFDSTRTTVVASNDLDLPVTIHIKWGKGNIYLNSTPLTFTNAYALTGNNPEFLSHSLSLLPQKDVIWTEFYHLGRMEVSSPLRFVLTTESLKWAYYLTVISILVFIIFEIKRKQRMIPVVKPLANTSLEFVTTIGNLYFQTGNHKDIADKKISFFMEQIRSRFWMDTNNITPSFINILAKRSGNDEEEVNSLFRLIHFIQGQTYIIPEDLMELNRRIEKFNKQQS